jgi:hypothetical protein
MNFIITTREELQDAIAAISVIKRFFICVVLKRKEHLLARSYSVITVDLLYKDHPTTMEMWAKSDELWAKLYGINYQPKA